MTEQTQLPQQDENHVIAERRAKLKALREASVDGIAFPNDFRPEQVAAELHAAHDAKTKEALEAATPIAVKVAGRIMLKRVMGKASFATIQDASGRLQLYVTVDAIGAGAMETFKHYDLGDIVGAEGTLFKTKTGELSVHVKSVRMITKSIRPLPEKFHGLADTEQRYRMRYVDLIMSPEVRNTFVVRSKIVQCMREFMVRHGYLEVETPMMHPIPGGAAARPFKTHHNALDMDVFLRISCGELWQKRLMVAGYEKVFEIGRIFRNEGMSNEHAQDYTQLEFYFAYANYEDGMKLVERMYKHVAQETFGTQQFTIRGFEVDLSKVWERYDYRETIKKFTDIDIVDADIPAIEGVLKRLKVEYNKKGWNRVRAIDTLWKYCRKQLSGPGFLINIPVEMSPLAKLSPQGAVVEQFQPIIAGSEVGKGYSELNDPIDQAQRFQAQQDMRDAGDEEAQMYDHEFVEALEHGMPPTCGFGVSERLFAFLADKPIREVQIFPLLKPKM